MSKDENSISKIDDLRCFHQRSEDKINFQKKKWVSFSIKKIALFPKKSQRAG